MARYKKATIREVAAAAGVSITTVSHLLGGRSETCSPETGRRIREAAARLHYTPSSLGRGMRTGGREAIGVIATDPFLGYMPSEITRRASRNGFSERLWVGILAAADEAGQRVVFYPERIRASTAHEELLDGSVDGMIMMTGHEDPRAARLAEIGMPVVVITRFLNLPPRLSAVYADEDLTVSLAFEALWERGHRRIAHLAGPVEPFPLSEPNVFSQNDIAMRRMDAYLGEVSRRGVYDPDLLAYGHTWTAKHAGEAVRRWRALPSRPTAILCASDLQALGVLRAAAEIGWPVPGELSVVGVDNVDGTEACTPTLATVDIDVAQIGREALFGLLDVVRGGGDAVVRRCLPVSTLVVRESLGPAP